MLEEKAENWLEPVVKNIHGQLKQQQAEWKSIDAKDVGNLKMIGDVRIHKPVCWSLDELYKENRVPKDNHDKIIPAIQRYLDEAGIVASDIVPKFKQHNCYLELALKDGRSIRIMDDVPHGEPVKSEGILSPEREFAPVSATSTIKNDAGVEESRTNKFHVAIFPKYKKLGEALANNEITTQDAKEQILALKKKLAEKKMLLWDPLPQNFGIDEKGKIFVSSSGAVCKEEERTTRKPFEPYAKNVTIAQLEDGGYKNLDTMLEEEKRPKRDVSSAERVARSRDAGSDRNR
jgi:hypothetical protein